MHFPANNYRQRLAYLFDSKRFPDYFEYLLENGRVFHHTAGRIIVNKNQSLNYVGLFLSGCVEVFNIREDGHEQMVTRLTEGTWYGEQQFLDGYNVPHYVQAVSDTLELRISYSSLRASDAPKSELYEAMACNLAQVLRLAHKVFGEHKIPDLEERLMTRLKELVDENGYVSITQEKLSSYLGVSRFKVLRMLEKLEQKGTIHRRYRRIKLCS